MGIKIYYYIVLAVLGFAIVLPQHGRQKKKYIVLMAALHTFVCGWRYMYITGDLIKYSGYYLRGYPNNGWFSEYVFDGGRNFGFAWLSKFLSQISNGDFQLFLIFIAVVTEIAVAVIIYRYSPAPWLSYLLWNCFGFYIFGFSAIKQALAMGLLMFAFIGVMEEKPVKFLFWTILAGCIHTPALIFLPAYWLAGNRLSAKRLLLYGVAAALVYVFRNPIVTFVSQFYYDEADYVSNTTVGGRFMMIAAMLLVGFALRGVSGRNFTKLFNLMFMATVLQMFSGFDNVFTRLTDYYFQFMILYLPMMLYPEADEFLKNTSSSRRIGLTRSQRTLALLGVILLSGLFYFRTNLNITITNEIDNYLNYRFCWEVKD